MVVFRKRSIAMEVLALGDGSFGLHQFHWLLEIFNHLIACTTYKPFKTLSKKFEDTNGKKHTIGVIRSADPQDTIWHTMGRSYLEQVFRNSIANLCMIVVCVGIFYWMEYLEESSIEHKQGKPQPPILQYGMLVIMILTTAICANISNIFWKCDYSRTRTDALGGHIRRRCMWKVMLFTAVPMLIFWDVEEWYTKTGLFSLVGVGSLFLIMKPLADGLLDVDRLPCALFVIIPMDIWWNCCSGDQKEPSAERKACYKNLNRPEELDINCRYVDSMSAAIMIFAFLATMPIFIPIAIVGTILQLKKNLKNISGI